LLLTNFVAVKKTCFLILVSGIHLISAAQPLRAYKDLDSYLNNKYVLLDSAAIVKGDNLGYVLRSEYPKPRRNGKVSIWSDERISIKLNKEYWAVERNDSLFINAGIVLGITPANKKKGSTNANYPVNGFEHVKFRSAKYLYFRGGVSNVQGIQFSNFTTEDNELIEAYNQGKTFYKWPPRFNYLFDITRNKVLYFNRGVMRNYIQRAAPEDGAFVRYVTELIKKDIYED
jgi:hypothetical protein